MKKHLILLLTCIGFFSFAQDWNLINPNYVYNYAVDGDYEISVYSDSVDVLGSDTTFYLNRIVSECDTCSGDLHGALLINQPTFLQREILKVEDQYFFTDTLSFTIFPKANLSESWLFDTLRNITAEIISVSSETILGISDSIKYIHLSTDDTIVISKHNGIIRFDVPMLSEFHLMGIEKSTESLGFVVPKFADFFNFEVGDVFQYKEFYGGGGMVNTGTTNLIKKQILSKVIYEDSVIYFIEENRTVHSTLWNMGSNILMDTLLMSPIFKNETFIDSVNHNANKYSQELYSNKSPFYLFNNPDSLYYGKIFVATENDKLIKRTNTYEVFFQSPDFQGLLINDMEGFSDKVYKTSLGIVRDNFSYFEADRTFELIGYIKNGDTTGTVYGEELYTSIKNNLSMLNRISVYPNPTKDYIYIKTQQKGHAIDIVLFDIYGKLLIKDVFDVISEVKLDLTGMNSGVYVLKVNGVSKRIIKK